MFSIKNRIFIYGKWVGNTQEWSRIYLEIILDLETVSKSPFWVPKPDFSTRDPGNTGEQAILGTRDPGNTGEQAVLGTCEPGTAVLWVSELILWVSELILWVFELILWVSELILP